MSVHQTKDGRWYVKYSKGKNSIDPERTKEYFGRGVEGERKAQWRNKELGLGAEKKSGKRFAECSDYYLKAKVNKISLRGWEQAHSHIDKHLDPFFGDHMVPEITEEMVDQYVNTRVNAVYHKSNGHENAAITTGVKGSTINRELTTLQAVLNLCVKRKQILYNPIQHYEKLKDDDAIIAEASLSELQVLIKVASPHLKRFIILAYYTSARPGQSEVLKIRWPDIDFLDKKIFVESAKKGGVKSRRISMHPALQAHLLQWYAEDEQRKTMPDFVVHYNGKRLANVNKTWQTAKKNAKILRRLRLYDIRHSSITHQLEAGGDLKAVSLNAGHSNPAMTMRRYQHVSTQLKDNAINGLGTIGTIEEDREDKKVNKDA